MAAATFTVAAQDQTHRLPLRDWIDRSSVESMRLSPDGKRLAGIGYGGESVAFVIDIDQSQTKIISRWRPYGYLRYGRWPVAINWISNDLLALDFSDREAISVNLAGEKVVKLGERYIRRMPEEGVDSDSVLAYRDVDGGEIDVVNARSGERTTYRVGLPGKVLHWAFDAKGALRAVTTMDTAFWSEKTKVSNWYRADEQSAWQLLEEGAPTRDFFRPIRVLAEPDSLAIVSRHDRDTYAVFRYDTAKHQMMEMMAGHPYEDIQGVSGLDEGAFEWVRTAGIKPQVSWFDPRWAGLQVAVDAALPGRTNLLQGDKNGRLLITSFGDVDPGRWYLLDTKTGKMHEVGSARPRIDPKQMRSVETIRYPSRDGLMVNAYLTRPPGAEPAPMVVLIHGGPHVRDTWHWDPEVQMLANHGYVVFQPQFRGSAGFGRKFEEAGYRQWGRTMQDDITDGVMHLVAQKIADPARICIYGASYGGYAALWGVIKTPDLYKCGVSFAGLSDLTEHASHSIMDDSTPASREIDRMTIGDPKEARAELDEVSPIGHADRVKVPLLIAHGELDTRVLPSQSKSMVRALERLGKPVEWMSFADAGHGLSWRCDEFRYYTALLAFLKRQIGRPDDTSPGASGSTDKRPDDWTDRCKQ